MFLKSFQFFHFVLPYHIIFRTLCIVCRKNYYFNILSVDFCKALQYDIVEKSSKFYFIGEQISIFYNNLEELPAKFLILTNLQGGKI